MTSQAIMLLVLASTHLGMGRRHPRGLGETEVCWAQRAGGAQTQMAAAEPCRLVQAWPPAFPGRAERPQSLGFQFLERCCRRIRTEGHLCCLGFAPLPSPSARFLCSLPITGLPTPGPRSFSQRKGDPGPERKAMGCTLPPALNGGCLTPAPPWGLSMCPRPCQDGRQGQKHFQVQPQEPGDKLLFGHRVNGIRTECPHSWS